jgi:hypothetical protein
VRLAIIGLALLGLAWHLAEPKLRFITPKPSFVMLGVGKRAVDVDVQVYIPRHPDNRAYTLTCHGACWRVLGPYDLDGEEAPAIHPRQGPAKMQVDDYGDAVFTVRVFNQNGKVRDSAKVTVKVCGGEVQC